MSGVPIRKEMKRLGKYSGNIYNEDEVSTMEECGVLITDDEANDKEFIKHHHARDLVDCIKCYACPMSKK